MIRRATPDDIPLIIEMGRTMHAEMRRPGAYDGASVKASTERLLDTGVVFVSERGMLGGFLMPAFWNAAHLMAAEVFWWAEDGQAMALLGAFEAWAAEHGASRTHIGTQHAYRGAAVGRLLRREGYTMTETYWTREMADG